MSNKKNAKWGFTRQNFRQKISGGFTLIELLVVIAIIGLLSSVVFVSLDGARKRARDARRIADFATIQTALELFYDQTGSYPRTTFGRSTGSMQWAYFSECLEKGTELRCGFTISNYQPVISKVPQDPSRSTSDPLADDKTYRPVLPVGCDSAGQSYRIAALLETNHSALESDLDGSSIFCQDSNKGYCVGVGTCSGW